MRYLYHPAQRGQSLLEFALLLVLVAAVVIGVLVLMGVRLADLYCQIVTGIGMETTLRTAGPLFQDDFSGGLDDWDFMRGNRWEQEEGQLCAGPGEHQGSAPNSQATDSTISMDVILHQGKGFGVFFRSSMDERGRRQGYIFQYDPGYGKGQFLFRKWTNGHERPPFARSSPPAGFQWIGVKRHIVVVVSGSTFTAKVDGQVVLTAQDSSYSAGEAGLHTWANSDVCFDDFTVTVP